MNFTPNHTLPDLVGANWYGFDFSWSVKTYVLILLKYVTEHYKWCCCHDPPTFHRFYRAGSRGWTGCGLHQITWIQLFRLWMQCILYLYRPCIYMSCSNSYLQSPLPAERLDGHHEAILCFHDPLLSILVVRRHSYSPSKRRPYSALNLRVSVSPVRWSYHSNDPSKFLSSRLMSDRLLQFLRLW